MSQALAIWSSTEKDTIKLKALRAGMEKGRRKKILSWTKRASNQAVLTLRNDYRSIVSVIFNARKPDFCIFVESNAVERYPR